MKKLNLDDDTLFLRPGQLKGEDHNSPSRLSMRKTWQYRMAMLEWPARYGHGAITSGSITMVVGGFPYSGSS